jgi:prepilin signal peptidase PulO-like enzyme (type II secretory pathway)
MVKKVSPELLTEGDWLYKKIRVGKKEIVPHWEGLENSDIEILRKVGKEVYIREGIPFVPVFLISFLILIYLYFNNLIFVF